MIAIKTRISKGELDIWAYPVALMIYAIAAAIFARKQKLAPKLKKSIQQSGVCNVSTSNSRQTCDKTTVRTMLGTTLVLSFYKYYSLT